MIGIIGFKKSAAAKKTEINSDKNNGDIAVAAEEISAAEEEIVSPEETSTATEETVSAAGEEAPALGEGQAEKAPKKAGSPFFAAVAAFFARLLSAIGTFFARVHDFAEKLLDRFILTKAGQAMVKCVYKLEKAFSRLCRSIYCLLFIFGARLVRSSRRMRRHLSKRYIEFADDLSDSWHRFWARFKLRWLNFWSRKVTLFHASRVELKMCVLRIKEAEHTGKNRIVALIREIPIILWACLKPLLRIIFTLFNYAAPVIAALLLVTVIRYFNSLTFAFAVEYDGEVIGYIENETKFDEAEKMVRDRLINEQYLQPTDSIPRFTLCVIDKDKFTSTETLANRIISASGNDVQTAYGLYIDDQFIGATDDSEALISALDARLEQYRTGTPGEVVSFVNKIRLTEGIYPSTSILPLSTIEQQLDSEVEGERYYTVVAGDSPIRIANKNNMKLADLVALNPGIMEHVYGGDEVLISKSEPFLGIKVTRRETYEIEVPYGTDKVSDPNVYNGVTSVKSKGVPGISEQIADVVYIDGVEVERTVISTTEITPPVNQVLSVGTYLPKPSSSSGSSSSGGGSNVSTSFIWPVNGGYVSCKFHGYAGHTGLDIAAPRGTAIYASAPGTVVFVKRLYYGYGLHLKVDHGGGVATLYAHCSNVYVSAGDFVSQGQTIAAVGMTGRATGTHLHFEIQINGVAVNPQKYV